MSDLDQGIETYDMMLRWSKGESLVDLGKECDPPISDAVLRLRMRKLDCIDYPEAKKDAHIARINLTTAKYERGEVQTLDEVLELLDNEATRKEMPIKDLLSINKQLGDRAALRKGEATERQEQVGKVTQIILFKDTTGDDTE